MLEMSPVGRFQNRICIVSVITSSDQEMENKILYMANEEMWAATFDSWLKVNSKSEEREGYY